MKPRTMFEKIWEAHLVRPADADTPAILYVDLHLVHEVTSPQAFTWLRERGLKVRRPGQTVAKAGCSVGSGRHAFHQAREARFSCAGIKYSS